MMLQNWAALDFGQFGEDQIHGEDNALLLCLGLHRLFNLFRIFFEATVS